MGDAQSVPIIGEAVTVIDSVTKCVGTTVCAAVGGVNYLVTGNENNAALRSADKLADGAANAWVEYSEKNLIAGAINCAVKDANGDHAGARRIEKKVLGSLEGFVDSVPVVGHVKGAVHYIAGDEEHGDRCMLGATRGAAVMAAGAVTGGVGGGVVLGGFAGVGGGVVYDTTVTTIDSAVHDEPRPHGIFATIDEIDKHGDPNDVIGLGLGLVGDFASGASAAKAMEQFGKAKDIKTQRNALTEAFERAQDEPGSAQFDANGATSDTVQAARNLDTMVENKVVKGDGHVSTVARNLETNEAHQGFSSRARQDANVTSYKQNGKSSGFNSKTHARKCGKGGTSTLQKSNPGVKNVLKRPQQACAEHNAFNNVPNPIASMVSMFRVVSVKFLNGVYRAVMRCENCLGYAEAMGSVVTDLIAGQRVPVGHMMPYIVKGCGCGALAVAAKRARCTTEQHH